MNRLEEFLQDLDTKNKILLYLSVVVVGIIIYYNINYNYLSSKIETNKKEIVKLKKENNININSYNKQIAKLKKDVKKLKLIANEKLKDLQYLNERINLAVVKIDDNKFYSLLEKILYKSSDLGLSPNFLINQNMGKFKTYTLEINGSLPECGYKNLFSFVKFLESQKVINNIDKFKMNKKNSNFYIRYNIWGIK